MTQIHKWSSGSNVSLNVSKSA